MILNAAKEIIPLKLYKTLGNDRGDILINIVLRVKSLIMNRINGHAERLSARNTKDNIDQLM